MKFTFIHLLAACILLSQSAVVNGTTHQYGNRVGTTNSAKRPTPISSPRSQSRRLQYDSGVLQGTVVLVSESHVTLSHQGIWTTFFVPTDAQIRVNNSEAILEQVQPGHFASVVGTTLEKSLVATVIDAKRQY